MKLNEGSRPTVEIKHKNFDCMKEEDTYINGKYDSRNGRMLRIKLMKCHDKPDCKTDQEITDFFTGKYLMLLHN